jgi:hypothetical protein
MSRREVTGKCAVNNFGETPAEWNYDENEGDNFWHRSFLELNP